MARLPIPGGDNNNWGNVLNDYLQVAHAADGTLQAAAITHAGGITTINGKTGSNGAVNLSADDLGIPLSVSLYGFSFSSLKITELQTDFPLNSGVFGAVLTSAPKTETITSLGTWVYGTATSPTGDTNALALYSEDGQLLAHSGDMTSIFEASGYQEAALLSPYQVTAGTNYYLAVLTNFSSPPYLPGWSTPSSHAFPAIRGHYPSVYLAGQRTLPASFTPSGANANSGIYFITAVAS